MAAQRELKQSSGATATHWRAVTTGLDRDRLGDPSRRSSEKPPHGSPGTASYFLSTINSSLLQLFN